MSTGGLITRISAGFAQGEHQLALGTVGKDRMEKSTRWQYCALDQAKVRGNIIEVSGDDMGTSNDRFGHLVTPGIETGEIDVPVRKRTLDSRS